MKKWKRGLSLFLAVSLLVSSIGGSALAQTGTWKTSETEVQQEESQKTAFASAFEEGEIKTWADAAEYLCGRLGFLAEDAADIKLTEESDDRYLAILEEKGILEQTEILDPAGEITSEQWESLLGQVYTDTVVSGEDAEALRGDGEAQRVLITSQECSIYGITAGILTADHTDTLELSDVTATNMTVTGASEITFSDVMLERLCLAVPEGETIHLRSDADTQLPEIVLSGGGSVVIEGNGAFGVIRVQESMQEMAVRATCSVINETDQALSLEGPDGQAEELASGIQCELVLNHYLLTFEADGEVIETLMVEPGASFEFPDAPEKDGCFFTTWYQDEALTETCSQFMTADGQTTFYARYVSAEEAITVHFETMGGSELEDQIFAKGESLLTKPVSDIYTEKEGYTFGGWCTDEACTNGLSYTAALEEDCTLYAYFVSNEAQTEEKDGTVIQIADLDWQGEILLTADSEMTAEEALGHVQVEAGTGELDPELLIKETADGWALYGEYYEKDDNVGMEPGSSFTVVIDGGLHFAGYSEDADTAVVSVYKEQVEVVGFSEDMTYVLWDEVLSYEPITYVEDENSAADTETEEAVTEADTETAEAVTEADSEAAEAAAEADAETAEENSETAEAISEETISDQTGENAEEIETAAYLPGELLVKADRTYKVGEIVAFYDGEIGRNEKSMDAYAGGEDFEGYVLFAEILSAEKEDEGIRLTFGYANPEDYLTDFDVHITDTVELEGEFSDADLTALASRIAGQVEENEELRAQMMVAVMSSQEVQSMLDDKYGEGAYSLAGITASMELEKPEVSLTVEGTEAIAEVSVSATATINDGDETLLTIVPKLSFSQSISVETSVDGGKLWIDLAVAVRATSKISLTVTATTGEETSVFDEAVETLSELVSPEGLGGEGLEYEEYDEKITDLMDTMSSIIETSLDYNELFNIFLLRIEITFYGLISLGLEVRLVGEVGVLATFGVEVIATSGEKIGFHYDFLKFKGSSYTEKLESSVTNNVYLIGKVGVRLGLRLTLSVTLCGIASAGISGTLYVYAELSGLLFNSLNMITGANTTLGALKFEVGLDLTVSLGLSVNLIIKTISKSWTVFTGRWPLWSTSITNSLSYMNEDRMDELWERSIENADHKTVFGFSSIPMKTWMLMDGSCLDNEFLPGKAAGQKGIVTLSIENLTVNGELVPEDDPRNALFAVGSTEDGQNPGYIYMDETVAAEYLCEDVALDLVVRYEDNSSTALIKKQEKTFHLEKQCAMAATTHNVKVVLYDWCAHEWGIPGAEWDQAEIYTTKFVSTHMLGSLCEPTATGELDLAGLVETAKSLYPEISDMACEWTDPVRDGSTAAVQYSVPRTSNFCFLTPASGTVRYDVFAQTTETEATYYLYVRRYDGYDKPDSQTSKLNIIAGEGIKEYKFTDPSVMTDEGVASDTVVELEVTLEDGYADLELLSSYTGLQSETSGSKVSFTMPASDLTVTLQAYKEYTVTYNYNYEEYGTYTTETVSGRYGLKAPEDPQIEGLTFRGWYAAQDISGDAYVFGEKLDADLTLYADWTCDVTVHFGPVKGQALYLDITGGEQEIRQIFPGDENEYYTFTYSTQRVGENPLDVQVPNYDEHQFMGWYLNAELEGEPVDTIEFVLTRGIDLYADWARILPISFDLNYPDGAGESMVYDTFAYEGYLMFDMPDDPVCEHYTFTGWYKDKSGTQPFDLSSDLVEKSMTLYAGWSAVPYGITYDMGGGTNAEENPSSYTVEDEFTLAAPIKDGYEFAGWTGTGLEEAAEEVTVLKGSSGERTYTANWIPITYSISYHLLRGTVDGTNPETYTIESDDIVLLNPSKDKYEFMGWIGTGLEEAQTEVRIPTGSTGDREYTATWHTDDPAENIADWMLEAFMDSDAYQTDLTREDLSLDTLDAALSEEVSAYIQECLETSEKVSGYVDDISFTVEPLGKEETAEAYIYTYHVTAVYEDDDANQYVRETEEDAPYTVKVLKRVPEISELPTAADLSYAQALMDSAITGGSVTWQETTIYDAAEMNETGVFSWEDETIVPYGGDNGERIYTVIFTPADDTAKLYAPCSTQISVWTQIGVAVTCTAEGRYYIAGDKTTTGSYTLTDATTGADLTAALVLKDGVYQLAEEGPGSGIAVTFENYALEDDQEGLYILVNETKAAENTVDILTVPQTEMNVTLPTVTDSYEYSTELNSVSFTTPGSVTYLGSTIDGTWSWKEMHGTLTTIGTQECTVIFTPTRSDCYEAAEYKISVPVTKKKVAVPTIADLTYNGGAQQAAVAASEYYTKTADTAANAGSPTPAGEYKVTLKLNDLDHYCWSDGTAGAQKEINYQVKKAVLTVSAGTNAKITPLGFGQILKTGTTVEKKTVNSKSVDYGLPAKNMISGYTCTYKNSRGGNETLNGTWEWTSQSGHTDKKLYVGTHGVSAVFKPTSGADNFETRTYSFTVEVEKAVPDTSACSFLTRTMYQTTAISPENPLSLAKDPSMTSASEVVNPNNGATVKGTWSWEDPEKVPTSSGYQNVIFTPEDTHDYATGFSDQAYVTVKDTITISGQVICMWQPNLSDLYSNIVTDAKDPLTITIPYKSPYNSRNLEGYLYQVEMSWKSAQGTRRITATCTNRNYNVSNSDMAYKYELASQDLGDLKAVTISATKNSVTISFNSGSSGQTITNDLSLNVYVCEKSTSVPNSTSAASLMAVNDAETLLQPTEEETETETSTEVESELTTEAGTEANTEPTTETSTEPTTEAGTEADTEANTEPGTEANTEPTTEAKPEPGTEAETEAKTEPTTEAKPEPGTEAETEAKTEPTTEAKPEPGTEANTEPAAETKPETGTEAETEAKTEPTTEAKSEPDTETETKAKAETTTEAETKAKAETTTEAETKAKAETVTEAETKAKDETATEAETKANTVDASANAVGAKEVLALKEETDPESDAQ